MEAQTEDGDRPALDRIRHPKKRALLAVFAQTGNIVRSARSAQVGRATHYWWLDTDPEYAAAFEVARRQSIDILESEALRRAVEGTEQYVIHAGEVVKDPENPDRPLMVRKYSDTLLKFLMEAAAPHKYRRNHPPTGEDDGVRIAGRGRINVIREEIATRQAALDALTRSGYEEN